MFSILEISTEKQKTEAAQAPLREDAQLREEKEREEDDSEERESLDATEQYWQSEHHKFLWSEYMQNLDLRSWHALGLCVPETFLPKGVIVTHQELSFECSHLQVSSDRSG